MPQTDTSERDADSQGELPGGLRVSRLNHSPAIAGIRLWRITCWREGTPAARGRDFRRTVFWKTQSWLSGRASQKQLNTPMASRQPVFPESVSPSPHAPIFFGFSEKPSTH